MNPTRYREDLPDIPARMRTLPTERGFPVPWFVAQVDGHYDFRVIGEDKLPQAVKGRLCWVCGQPLGKTFVFTIGPMCALNKTISEPPSHRDCADFSARACPFLTQREATRRTAGLPTAITKAAGVGLPRQPGVICLWATRSYHLFVVAQDAVAMGGHPGILFRLGDPVSLAWYRQGRPATPEEIWTSVATGLPELRRLAIQDGLAGVLALEAQVDRWLHLVPALRHCERAREEDDHVLPGGDRGL